jgi:hypothetical protein
MNAVEIEEAVTQLAAQPFDSAEFPYVFLQAFGNKETTIKRLRSGTTNKSDVGGVLQTNNIHIAVAPVGDVTNKLLALKNSPTTTKTKARFVLSTDGEQFEAEDVQTGDTIACAYTEFPDHFGFFLPLAGITTVKQLRDSSFDIRATSRLNRLYIELLKDNSSWATASQRHEMNHFMARLIFCFFAEDTGIFNGNDLFTATVEQMSDRDSSNTHTVISEMFRAMNTKITDRSEAKLPRWADGFPYVNGGLFSGSVDVPRFSKISRSYLLHIGSLDWTKINPDIFGSMIQAVADDEERGELGMHYTSVPNILKVLDPLFLDDLREKLAEAGDNPRMLLNLRKRIARIRVFDPACGSGNFLVIAYKQMREIENTINVRRGELNKRSEIPITNFRGIELRDFSAEIARLALIIAEYQCDVQYLGQREALAEFLPLNAQNWITCGNALRLDWLSICPPTGTGVKMVSEDLFETSLDQAEIDFENEGGETYICGNPPYKGSNWRTEEQTQEIGFLFSHKTKNWKALDYVTGWLIKAAEYSTHSSNAKTSFVTTNSICQGLQVSVLWPIIFHYKQNIFFAHTSFKWANLASNNAGVSVIIIGLTSQPVKSKTIFEIDSDGKTSARNVEQINAYLLNAKNIIIEAAKTSLGFDATISDGSGALDGGGLILTSEEKELVLKNDAQSSKFIKPYLGSSEFIRGNLRWCLWIDDSSLEKALLNPEIRRRIDTVKEFRMNAGTRAQTALHRPHKFAWINKKSGQQIIIPTVFSERREYITAGYLDEDTVINNAASIVHNAGLYVLSIISSKLHIAWVKAISGKLKTDIRYTSATCFNTFPVPMLTEKNKADLTRCAENILLAREAHFPATIADLYNPDTMPENLRTAHERNDEVLERIYIGRRFRNDTERLEKLFDLYTKMTANKAPAKKATRGIK